LAPILIFGSTEGVESRFNVLRFKSHFRCYRRRRVPFSCFALLDSLSAVLWASAPIFMFGAPGLVFGTEGVGSCSCFAHLNSFSAVATASAPVFMFCAPGLAFGGTEGVGSCTCFAQLNSFSAVPTASGPVFGGSEGVESHFHVFGARTHFRQYRGRRVSF
jgi:hypothetical protein